MPLPGIEIKLDASAGAPFRRHGVRGAARLRPAARPAPPHPRVRRDDWFRWANPWPEPARILCLFAPAGFEQFFADIHESMRVADYDLRRFGEVLAAQRAAYGDEEHSGV